MIRKLKELDRRKIMIFLSDEVAINLFIVGDIENFGFDKEFQEVWGSFDDKTEKLNGVLLRYNENYVPYFKDDKFDISGFEDIIKRDKKKIIISGKESIVIKFKSTRENTTEKSTYFCELSEGSKLKKFGDDIKIATVKDAGRIHNLIQEIKEFSNLRGNSIEEIERGIKTKTGRKYYMENDSGEMITIAQTAAENSRSAMIVGVATKMGYRKKGLMSQCLSKLCFDILSEGKSLCLFYDNPKAGSVYHKMGFKSIEKWMMLVEAEK